MEGNKGSLKGEVVINAPLEKVWELWIEPEHIKNWNIISNEWHTPIAENDFRVGGKLYLKMEALDKSDGFDYECIYEKIVNHKEIRHVGKDGRKTKIEFETIVHGVKVTEIFEPEDKTPLDVQEAFCQSILNNFKKYVERTV
jgi:uncharacterized protein YndB with AHSA1/START domain